MRVLIATVKVPFIRGGAELHAEGLLEALRAHGHEADLVAIPYKHYPPERILDHMLACRLLDLTESFGTPIDRLIAFKFPAYLISHPHKVLWLMHQHRQAYDLWAHPRYGDLMRAPNGRQVRDAIRHADQIYIGEARAVFTSSCNVSRRLKEGSGIDSTPLYHPPPSAGLFYSSEAEDYLFCPSRVSELKRQPLILQALAKTRRPVSVWFVGTADNPDLQAECDGLVREFGLAKRVRWLGNVSEEEKRDLYARALGVIFTPLDEDYGYITLEAMLAAKPVIACTDSGGPLEFIKDGKTGFIAAPEPDELAAAMDSLWLDRSRAASMGRTGRQRYDDLNISWDHVVKRLLA